MRARLIEDNVAICANVKGLPIHAQLISGLLDHHFIGAVVHDGALAHCDTTTLG